MSGGRVSKLVKKILEKKKTVRKAGQKEAFLVSVITGCFLSAPLIYFLFKGADIFKFASLELSIFEGVCSAYIAISLLIRAKNILLFKYITNTNKINNKIRKNKNYSLDTFFFDSDFLLKRMKLEEVDLKNIEEIKSETQLSEEEIQIIQNNHFPSGINNQADYISFLLMVFEEEKIKIKSENYNERLGEIIKKIDENKIQYKKEERDVVNR